MLAPPTPKRPIFSNCSSCPHHPRTTHTHPLYPQGSFETIGALCKASTLPADFASVARQHALEGCYVLALAKRLLSDKVRGVVSAPQCVRPSAQANARVRSMMRTYWGNRVPHPKPLSPPQADPATAPLPRDEVERDLTFVGLIIFRHELREDSPATIAKLKVREQVRTSPPSAPCAALARHAPHTLVLCVIHLTVPSTTPLTLRTATFAQS